MCMGNGGWRERKFTPGQREQHCKNQGTGLLLFRAVFFKCGYQLVDYEINLWDIIAITQNNKKNRSSRLLKVGIVL